MDAILEILKYVLPALVVFMTVYMMMKNYLDNQINVESLKVRQKQLDNLLPSKLQAYERLILFTERVSPQNLAFRLSAKDSSAQALAHAMMIAVQEEYQHNISQQIYVSDALWDVVETAKDNMLSIIDLASNNAAQDATPVDLLQSITDIINEGGHPMVSARAAIKKEVQTLL